MRLLIVFFFVTTHLFAVGQIDRKRFENIFDEETNNDKYSKRENHSGVYQFVPPQDLPDWFVSPPISSGSDIFSIGISDPEMDTTEALEQAILRAEIMANVFRKATTQLLCDFFSNEVNQSNQIVFEHFARVSAKLPNQTGNYELVNTYRNRFDETLVLIKYIPPKRVRANQLQTIKLELYRSEVETSSIGEYESIYELIVQPESVSEGRPAFFQLTELGKRSDVVSGKDKEEKQVPIYSLKYTGLPMADSAKACFLSHGLWKDYYKSALIQMLEKAREKPENISYLGDNYNSESFQKLTRGVSVNKMRFVLTGIKGEQNQLKVTLKEIPLE
jgi:hypothetical protein